MEKNIKFLHFFFVSENRGNKHRESFRSNRILFSTSMKERKITVRKSNIVTVINSGRQFHLPSQCLWKEKYDRKIFVSSIVSFTIRNPPVLLHAYCFRPYKTKLDGRDFFLDVIKLNYTLITAFSCTTALMTINRAAKVYLVRLLKINLINLETSAST